MDLDTTISNQAPEAPPEPIVEATPVANDLDVFTDESDGVAEEVVAPTSPPVVAPSVPIPEGTPVTAAPASSVGVPPTATVQASPPAVVATPAPPAVPMAPPAAPVASEPLGDPIMVLAHQRENLVTEIASRYEMPEAVRDQFALEPEKVLPVMAARLYVDIFDAVVQTVRTQIPQMMAEREQATRISYEAENRFFGRWPSLKDPQYVPDIVAIGRAYRQQNPRATTEQAVEAIGAMVSVARGVQPQQTQTNGQPAQAPPQYRPPVPAGAGASRLPAPAAPPSNIWSDVFVSGPDD